MCSLDEYVVHDPDRGWELAPGGAARLEAHLAQLSGDALIDEVIDVLAFAARLHDLDPTSRLHLELVGLAADRAHAFSAAVQRRQMDRDPSRTAEAQERSARKAAAFLGQPTSPRFDMPRTCKTGQSRSARP
ncbi:MAG: hypothetical protein IPK13_10905 [Deltaproteobacteria bacterium]|nr:hypothetical protein [Deltaproteobacteria bacterium]